MPPRVAIIYLTYNGPESHIDIPRCFESMTKLTYPMDRMGIICVENPSKHGTSWSFIERDWLARTDIPKIVHIEKNAQDLGYSGACNVGIRFAQEQGYDYAFLLNQDGDVHPDMITKAVERAEQDPKIAFVQSLILLGQEKDRVNSIGNQLHFLGFGYAGGYRWTHERAILELKEARAHNPDLEVPYYSGAAVLVRLSVAKALGEVYDTPFYMYHEDVDATLRARLRGYKTVIEPESIMYHYYAFSKSIKKFYWMERNRYIVHLTIFRWPTILLLAIPGIFVELASFLFAIKSGWWRERLRAWGFLLRPSTWAWIYRRRQQIQSTRVVSDRFMLQWVQSRILFQEEEEKSAVGKTGVNGNIITKFANPGLELIWNALYSCIRW